MKFVVYALILGNMVMLGWLYQNRGDYRDLPVSATQLPESIEPLVLLRERAKQEPAIVPADVSAGLPKQSGSPSSAHTPIPPTDVMTGVATDHLPAEPVVHDTDQVPAPETAILATETSPARICQTIGPFAERQAAVVFATEVSGLGPTATVRAAHIEQPSGYWVYLPSMSRTQAEQIVSDLEKMNVEDYFLGRQNFISLGIFNDKRSAEARARAIIALGYIPQLEPRFLSREVYWLDVEETISEPVSADQWTELLANRAGLRRQPLTCE